MRKSVFQLFGGNLISKGLGLGREMLSAALFGTGEVAAAYRVAQTGTLSPINFFTSDSLNSVFVPLYRRFSHESPDKLQAFIWTQIFLFLSVSMLVGIGLWVLAAPWVAILAPGLRTTTAMISVDMLRIMGLGVPFYLMSVVFMFLSMAREDFVPMALRPVVQNTGMIVGIVVTAITGHVQMLAWGFAVAYIAYLIWVIWRVVRNGWLALPSGLIPGMAREVMTAFWITLRPLLLLPFLLQGNIIIERMVASLISEPTVAALDYARFISETLLLLVSTPIAFVGLTQWSGMETEDLRSRLRRAVLFMMLLVVPIASFLAVHAGLVVKVMYMRGRFNHDSAALTTDILFGMSLGLWAQAIGYVLIKAMSAQLRNRSVLMVMMCALVGNAMVNIMAYRMLGPLTLGLGNSVYGLVIFFGSLFSLGLWRECWHDAQALVVAASVYAALSMILPLPESPWLALIIASLAAALYWGLVVAMRSELRESFFGALRRNREVPV